MRRRESVKVSKYQSVREQGSIFFRASALPHFRALQGIFIPWVLAFLFVLVASIGSTSPADAKIYIDVTSPGAKPLPIAVQPFSGGKELSDIVKGDLTFTGLFDCIDDNAHIERPDQPFNPNNWQGLGAELVVKGQVTLKGRDMMIVMSAYDVAEGREVLKKEYSAKSELLRPLAHSVANDIYKLLTSHQGVFRTRIAFVGEKNGKKELCIMDWDGYRTQWVGLTSGIMLMPRWSSEGATLVYSAERNHQWGLYALDMGTMRERKVVRLNGLAMAGNFFPDNKEFTFAYSKNGTSDIYVGNIATMQVRKLVSSPWIDVSPAVSPDGSSILFVSNRSGGPQVFITDKNGNGSQRVTMEGSYNTSPSWSPKGDRIVYASMMGGRNQIFTVKPDGSGVMQLTDKGSNEEPSFSPDGRFIVFTSNRDGSKGIYIMRANGEGQKRITPKGLKAINPSWSPLEK